MKKALLGALQRHSLGEEMETGVQRFDKNLEAVGVKLLENGDVDLSQESCKHHQNAKVKFDQ